MNTATDFWVGDRLVRPSLGKIERGLEKVHVEPRSMEVLLVLVERRPEVVSKSDLIDAVWGEAFVSEGVIAHAVSDLRRALGDSATAPEFIQTIPKRGYRLMAPVTEENVAEEDQPPPRANSSRRGFLWGLALLAAATGATIWVSRDGEAPAPVATEPGGLVLVLRTSPEGASAAAAHLDSLLLEGLAGSPGLQVRPAPSCAPASGRVHPYCLEPTLRELPTGIEIGATLQNPAGVHVYAVPPITARPADAAEEISNLVRAYFGVIRQKHWNDPDIMPWISIQRNDIRAIQSFLLGIEYIYLDRPGGRDALKLALVLDPDFIAPRVLRTPTMVVEENREVLDPHRADLERLWPQGTDFEKAMIQWAISLIDRRPQDSITHLRAALVQEPKNRPTLNALGATLLEQGDIEEAWKSAFRPLLDPPWEYPGLHTLAAECARRLKSVEDLRLVLDSARSVGSSDATMLALRRLLSFYDGDRGQDGLKETLARAAEGSELDLYAFARLLADAADREGRSDIAARLREFAD